MYLGSLNLGIVIIIFIFSVPIGLIEFSEYLHILKASSFSIRQGTVIKREELRHSFFSIPAGQLTIQSDGIDGNLTAITSIATLKKKNQHVSFHYTNDPAVEVFLEGEENPLWVAIPALISPLLILTLWLWLRKLSGYKKWQF